VASLQYAGVEAVSWWGCAAMKGVRLACRRIDARCNLKNKLQVTIGSAPPLASLVDAFNVHVGAVTGVQGGGSLPNRSSQMSGR
jgi:hypothetical protein